MRTPADLFPYQKSAVAFQTSEPASALWVSMGLGKTVVTLTSISNLKFLGVLNKVIVVAPLRVCRMVWRQEALKWSHLKHLKFSMVLGDRDKRSRALLHEDADIYLVNYENLEWLASAIKTYYIDKGRPVPFNGLVWDELSKMKNSTTHRVRAMMKVINHFDWITGLTGTPASNGFKDLHGQFLVLDKGKRLGESKTRFMTQYFRAEGYKVKPYADTLRSIKDLIGDMTLEMSAADYNPLPDMIVNDVEVELDHECREAYDQMERDMFLLLDSGSQVEMFNQASLTNKCLQYSNGAVYINPGMPLWEPVHSAKLEALDDIIEEAGGQPILLSYAYRSDAQRIMERYKALRPINLTECKSEKSLSDAMHRWVTGDCALMIGHPASMGHGIDGLQRTGHILVWFGLNWSLDLYDQMNARIRRQGQGAPVICHRIMCKDTLDQAQAIALDGKANDQASLRLAVKEYRKQKEKGLLTTA